MGNIVYSSYYVLIILEVRFEEKRGTKPDIRKGKSG